MSPSNLKILAWEETPLGVFCLRQRRLLSDPGRVVTDITVDHELLMTDLVTDSEEALSGGALARHPGRDLRVLVGGLGLGHTAHAVLASDRVAQLTVVEYVPQVVDWLRSGLIPLSAALLADPRLAVVQGDVYARLAQPPSTMHGDRWDLVLIDVDHSPDEQLSGANAPFYTDEGLTRARAHLAPGGLLGVWSHAASSPFADALRRVFPEVTLHPVTAHDPAADETLTHWLFFARA